MNTDNSKESVFIREIRVQKVWLRRRPRYDCVTANPQVITAWSNAIALRKVGDSTTHGLGGVTIGKPICLVLYGP
jgi:hypothetical protein